MDRWLLVFSVVGFGLDPDSALEWALAHLVESPHLVLGEDIEYERADCVSAERALRDLLLPYTEWGEA